MDSVDLLVKASGAYLGGGRWLRDAVVGIRGERVVFVDTADAATELVRSSGAEMLDASSSWLVPAFIDSHTHVKRASLVGHAFIDCSLPAIDSIDAVLKAVDQHARQESGLEWIQGDHLNPLNLAEKRFPTRYELDRVSQGRPVILRGVGRHAVAANSRALAAAGIDRSTQAPPGGRIEVDEDGEPTGVLQENAKLGLDTTRDDAVVPPVPLAIRLDALEAALAQFHEFGVSAIHDIPRSGEELGDYLELKARGRLATRVTFYVRGYESSTKVEHLTKLGLRPGFGDQWTRLGGVKLSVDGSATFGNAAIHGEYANSPGNNGLVRIDGEKLTSLVAEAKAGGFPVAIHAIGDRALDMSIEAFEAQRAQAGEHRGSEQQPAYPDRVEHAFVRPGRDRLRKLARLGVVLSTQPGFIRSAAPSWRVRFDDQELQGFLPVRSAMEEGCQVLLNSDYPAGPPGPLVTLQSAVTRADEDGNVVDPDEAVSVEEAFAAMTTSPAEVAGPEHGTGKLEVGGLADLVVLSEPFTDVPGNRLIEVGVEATIVGGTPVFQR